MVALASVFVPVQPVFSDFATKTKTGLAAGFNAVDADIAAAGVKHGRSYGTGFAKTGAGEVRKSGGLFRDALAPAALAMAGLGAIKVFAGFVTDARESAKVAALTEQVIKTTGGAAHITAGQVSELATSISNKTGVDDEAVQSGANLLLTFTNVRNEVGRGNDIFNQTTAIITDMSVALGQSLSSSAMQVGKALQDPIAGLSALGRVGVKFNDQQIAQIKLMVKSGDVMGAQKVILAELGRQFGGAAAAASTPMQKLSVAVGNLGEQIGTALLPAIDSFATFAKDDLVPAVGALVSGLQAVPTPVYAVAAGMLGVVAAVKTGSAVLGTFRDVTQTLGSAMEFLGIRTAAATTAEVVNTGAATADAAATTALGNSATLAGAKFGTLVARLGAVGFALAAVPVAGWLAESSVATVKTDELSSAIVGLGTSADVGFRKLFNRAGWGDLKIDSQSSEEALNQFEGAAKIAFGSSWTDRAQRLASFGVASKQAEAQIRELDASMAGLVQHGHSKEAADAFQILAQRMRNAGVAEEDIAKAFPQYSAAAAAAGAASDVAASGATNLAHAQHTAHLAAVAHDTALRHELITLKAETDAFLAGRSAARDLAASRDDLTRAIKENKRGLDINTAAGRANAEALDRTAAATLADLTQRRNAGLPLRLYAQAVTHSRDTLIKEAEAAGMTKKAAREYADQILKVPIKQTTTYRTPGLDAARSGAQGLKSDIASINGKTISINYQADGSVLMIARSASGSVSSRRARALGGPIDGWSPNPTADNIPVMATAGEHVWSVAEVQGAGGHPGVERLRRAALTGALPRFAVGGPVVTTAYKGQWPKDPMSNLMNLYGAGLAMRNASTGTGPGGGGGSLPSGGGSGVERWRGVVLRALGIAGQPSGYAGITLKRMNQESGGNPTIVNKWDSNWQRGTPSVGLMQVIGPTYARYHHPAYNSGPFSYGTSVNPLANILASMRYALGNYGSLQRAYGRAGGYDAGGWVGPGQLARNTSGQPERILDGQASREYTSSRGRPIVVAVYLDGERVIDDRVRVVVEDGFDDAGRRL